MTPGVEIKRFEPFLIVKEDFNGAKVNGLEGLKKEILSFRI